MKIVILNTAENKGGAAIAANRLMKALNLEGVEARMLVKNKSTNDDNVTPVSTTWIACKFNLFRFYWERLVIYIVSLFDRKNLFSVSIANTGTDISKHPIVRNADIIHLHWINQGFLSLSDIRKLINLNKPMVWTMHDLWITNGVYHYPEGNKLRGLNLEKIIFNKKQKLPLSKITFLGCSKWITEQAKKSPLLQNAKFVSIPNTIDTSVFTPIEKAVARNYFDIPQDKFIILFVADRVSEIRKGVVFFIEACHLLFEKYPDLASKMEIVLMGGKSDDFTAVFPFPIHSLEYLTENKKIAMAYSLANMFIIPSLGDNLPNTIMEAMSCGTPCVGFDIGGIPEMIDHKENGYVAKYKSAEDLAEGIVWVLNNETQAMLSQKARDKVLNTYSQQQIASQHIALYNSILKDNKNE